MLAPLQLLASILVSLAWADGSCEPFRLDWIAGGPFNPSPLAENNESICSDVPPSRLGDCLERHKGDGAQHAYVPAHDQGGNGTCTFQALAQILNYQNSMNRKPVTVSPEYLASQDCDSLLPNAVHNLESAVTSYNHAGSCSRGDLAAVGNGGRLSFALTDAMKRELASNGGGSPTDLDAICTAVTSTVNDSSTRRLALEMSAILANLNRNSTEASKFATWMSNAALPSAPDTRRDDYFMCLAQKEVFEPLCRKRHESARPQYGKQTWIPEGLESRSNVLNELVDGMERSPHPIEIRLEHPNIILRDSSPNPDGSGHALLLIGRQMLGGHCGYWLRNSWGTICPATKKTTVHCDPARPGNVWVDGSQLASNDGVTHYIDVRPK